MFSLFKINDPYRLIAIVIIAIAIKLPFIVSGCFTEEMQYSLLIGAAVDDTSMYKGVLDNHAPLAAGIYWLIDAIFGKSTMALQILGTLLLILQAVIFNNLAMRNKVYEQNTYLPAFIYLIIGSIQYELSVFSPTQLGVTFVLLALSQLLSHVEFRAKRDEQIMSIGLLVGIASLFYLQLFLFLPIILIILVIFTNTLSRRYAILIISAIMPITIAFAYYWILHDDTAFFINHLIWPTISLGFNYSLISFTQLAVYLPLFLLFLIGYFTMPKQRRLNNYQNRLARLFFIIAVLLLGIPLVTQVNVDSVVLFYLPVLAFISTHLFYLIKKPLTDLGVSFIFIGSILYITYQTEFQFSQWPGRTNIRPEVNPALVELISGKRIWVLGDHKILYTYGQIGTKFFDWSLSTPYLDHLNYYDNLVFIKESIEHYKPEIILDYEFRWKTINSHFPSLTNEYEQVKPFVWVKK